MPWATRGGGGWVNIQVFGGLTIVSARHRSGAVNDEFAEERVQQLEFLRHWPSAELHDEHRQQGLGA